MASDASSPTFTVWGDDYAAYGPVELPTLVSWIKDARVTASSWVFLSKTGNWTKASEIPELQMFFRPKNTPASGMGTSSDSTTPTTVDPRSLRRIKILSGFDGEQLDRFAKFVEVEKAAQWKTIVRQGEPGNSMYFILDGELRVRMDVMGKETILTTLGPGDFFGDISLFDRGPRSADVVANVDSTIVKFTAAAFDQLSKEAPELATPFLKAIGRTLTARIRADNKRIGDSFKFSRAANEAA